jgi:hypothetical protein
MRIETRVSHEVSIITIARFERKLECDDKFNKPPNTNVMKSFPLFSSCYVRTDRQTQTWRSILTSQRY